MIQKAIFALTSMALLSCTGCLSSNRIVGSNLHEEGAWYGELGITGHLNEVVIRSGSTITKLSVLGDANKITVEERVSLGKIEIWGENNLVSIPQRLVVRINKYGSGTRIHRREAGESISFPIVEADQPYSPEIIEDPANDGEFAPAPEAEDDLE